LTDLFRIEPDPADGPSAVIILLNFCILLFIIASAIIFIPALINVAPPEPQWWLALERAIGVTL
jgi:hypothetical protein